MLLLLALHLALSVPDHAPQTATLCLNDLCSARTASDVAVERSDIERRFVWISPNARQIIVGRVGAGASTLSLDRPDATHELAVRFSGAPVPVKFELFDGDTAWTWTMAVPSGSVALRHSNGTRLTIGALEHRTTERILSPSVPNLGSVDLQRFPVLTGRVVDAKSSIPVPDAEVFLSSGKRAATTDAAGRFRVVIEDAWPAAISVASSGHASKIVPLLKTVTDTDLSRIALSAGGGIHLTVSGVAIDSLSWQLRAIVSEFKDEPRREGAFTPGQTETSIDGIEPGEYRIVVKGSAPLEQFSRTVTVRDGQRSDVQITIHPRTIRIETRLGVNALGDADVEVRHLSARWTARMKTDETGLFETDLWQGGELEAIMSRMPAVHSWRDRFVIDEDQTRWTIRAVDRKIRGRVVDAESGKPVEGAVVLLEMEREDGQALSMRAVASSDGSFEFGAVVPGGHTLQAVKTGYQPDQKWSVGVAESDELIEKILPIEPYAGQVQLIAVTDRGMPIAGASVFFASRAGVREIAATDSNGRTPVPLTFDGETGVLFVVPQSGSLGFARVTRVEERDSDEVIVRVPAGSARVEIRAENTSGEPLPRIGLMMRWNGMFLPQEVVGKINEVQGTQSLTDLNGRIVYSHLPPGLYDLWPFASQEEFRRVYYGTPPPPAASVQIAHGPHTVVLNFSE